MLAEHDLPLVCFADDLAAALRCSRRTIDRLRHAGQLPVELPIPGRARWSREAILGWIAAAGSKPRKGRR